MRITAFRSWTVSAFACATIGCAAAPPAADSPAAPKSAGVEQFFPLGDGYVYTYETVESGGKKDMLLLRVRRLDAHSAQIQTSSGHRDLSISQETIRRQGSGFVLRAPLRQGATWDGENGGNTRLDAVDVRVEVPAGTFEGCLRTVEEIGGDSRGRITSVYCKGVGIAQMHVEQWQGGEHGSKRFVLKSYGPPVDLDSQR